MCDDRWRRCPCRACQPILNPEAPGDQIGGGDSGGVETVRSRSHPLRSPVSLGGGNGRVGYVGGSRFLYTGTHHPHRLVRGHGCRRRVLRIVVTRRSEREVLLVPIIRLHVRIDVVFFANVTTAS
jgi:hypothetical protein